MAYLVGGGELVLDVMFILLISVLLYHSDVHIVDFSFVVPPAQQSPFLYVNGLLYTSF